MGRDCRPASPGTETGPANTARKARTESQSAVRFAMTFFRRRHRPPPTIFGTASSLAEVSSHGPNATNTGRSWSPTPSTKAPTRNSLDGGRIFDGSVPRPRCWNCTPRRDPGGDSVRCRGITYASNRSFTTPRPPARVTIRTAFSPTRSGSDGRIRESPASRRSRRLGDRGSSSGSCRRTRRFARRRSRGGPGRCTVV